MRYLKRFKVVVVDWWNGRAARKAGRAQVPTDLATAVKHASHVGGGGPAAGHISSRNNALSQAAKNPRGYTKSFED